MPADTMSTLLMIGLMVLAFWFLLIRPAQKKQKQQQEMVSQLHEGARVMTTAGVFATITQLGDRQVVLEISPGVEMTVLKQAVMKVVPPSEDEFTYDENEVEDGAELLEVEDGAELLEVGDGAEVLEVQAGGPVDGLEDAPSGFERPAPDEPSDPENKSY